MNFVYLMPDVLRAESVGCSVAIRTQNRKLIYWPLGDSELNDLQAEPYELVNRYDGATSAAVQSKLEARLLAHMVRTSDVTPFSRDAPGLPA